MIFVGSHKMQTCQNLSVILIIVESEYEPVIMKTITVYCVLPQPAGIKFTQRVSGQKSAFSPPVGKTMRWTEKWLPPFRMGTTSSITMQSLGDRTTRAGCRCENMVLLFVTLGLPARAAV